MDVSCGTGKKYDSVEGMLWKFNDVLMAPQGRGSGATSQEGACENANFERQGCSPFYQDLIEDPYVDTVSGLRPVFLVALCFVHSYQPSFFLCFVFSPQGILSNYSKNCMSRLMTGQLIRFSLKSSVETKWILISDWTIIMPSTNRRDFGLLVWC